MPAILTNDAEAYPNDEVVTMADEQHDPARIAPGAEPRVAPDYIRFVALGDSATYGLGDRVGGEWRGWARILADAIGETHHVSFCNVARPGAVVAQVLSEQLDEALAHRPVIASLVVGVNDVMSSSWDPERIRTDLLECAEALARAGALVVTVRFHDHSQVLRLPRWLARTMAQRIAALNVIYDEVHERFGTIQIDLAAEESAAMPGFWSADRLHPSERGHRYLARRVALALNDEGLRFALPSARCSSSASSTRETVTVLVREGAPWVVRRARDLGPWAARRAIERARDRRTPTAETRSGYAPAAAAAPRSGG